MTDANELLMSGGVKSAKFETIGDTVVGTIVDDPKAVQMRKYESEELDYWPSGDPKMQIVITIQTDQRDAGDPQDDGRRRLHIPPRMMQPVREAIVRAGAKGLAIGGRIAVRWFAGTGQGQGNPKQYQAEYQPPTLDPGSLMAQPVAPAAVPPPTQQPLSATMASAAAAPAMTQPAAVAPNGGGLLTATPVPLASVPPPAGVDPNVWATMPDGQRQAVLAAMANTPGY